jgi:hypothetical protein
MFGVSMSPPKLPIWAKPVSSVRSARRRLGGLGPPLLALLVAPGDLASESRRPGPGRLRRSGRRGFGSGLRGRRGGAVANLRVAAQPEDRGQPGPGEAQCELAVVHTGSLPACLRRRTGTARMLPPALGTFDPDPRESGRSVSSPAALPATPEAASRGCSPPRGGARRVGRSRFESEEGERPHLDALPRRGIRRRLVLREHGPAIFPDQSRAKAKARVTT